MVEGCVTCVNSRAASLQTAAARIRMPLLWGAVVALLASAWVDRTWLFWASVGLLVPGLTCYFRLGIHHHEPVVLTPPVSGRWLAVNSPADRVPSHHLTAYGQGHAVDLVHEPPSQPRSAVGWWPLARRPEAFPGFGQPVCSPANGTIVRATGWHRDHWSRTSWPALVYLLVESVRELLGPGQILGNHVVVDCGGGQYAVLAHLRRHSVRVQHGERVRAGQRVAECGNSGNSTEPHLHVQLMDHPNPLFAAGLPILFRRESDPPHMPRARHELLA